jgi:hypothetical protein
MTRALRVSGLIVVAVFVVIGLAVAFAFLPLLIALGVLAGLGVLCFRDEEPQPGSRRLGSGRERGAVIVGTVVVVGCYAAIGMTAVWGGAATAVVAATALGVFGLRRRQAGTTWNGGSAADGRPGDRAGGADADTTSAQRVDRALLPADPTTMGLDELCRAWRVSYLLLQKARGPDELEQVVRLRRQYLDELARRHPEGFRRWLDEGARASGDPSRYVRRQPRPPEQDEDEAA